MIASLREVWVSGEHGRHALAGISLQLDAGESVALVGRNGSGKTTVLRVLAGLTRPTRGSAEVFGVDPGALDDGRARRVREQIGYAFESFGLWSTRTVGENVALPLVYHRGGGDVVALARELGIEGALGLLPARVDASVKKRALLARALVLGPRLLLCDEPGFGLVHDEAAKVARAIERRRAEGMTVLMTDHDGELGPYVATRRLHLDGGVLVDGARPRLAPCVDVHDDELPPASLRAESVRGSLA